MAWVETRFRHLGIIFYGINTAQPPNPLGLPSREVNSDSLAKIDDRITQQLKGYPDEKPMVIGLAHHNPYPASDDESVTNPDDFKLFFSSSKYSVKTDLFMHGHVHQHKFDYNKGLVRSCATTLTKQENARPPDSLRGFNLITLERENHEVKSISGSSYGWVDKRLTEISPDHNEITEWSLDDKGVFREKTTN